MSEMIERVARAPTIQEGSDPDGSTTIADRPKRWMLVIEDARSAIAAMREPTEAMARAVVEHDMMMTSPHIVWRSMIDEALK